MLIPTPDGRSLQVLDTGGDGLPCLYHGGSPGGPVPFAGAVAAAAGAGLRWLTYARPGYGDSTPLPDRDVAQAAADSAAVLDALGLEEFVTYGLSGGGPHALACAARLPDRCLAAASVAGVAPFHGRGLDFLAGMGQGNVDEFGFALEGRSALMRFLLEELSDYREVTGDQVVQALDSLVSDVDRAALDGELGEELAASFREGLRVGVDGWLDDDLAFVRPWGFAPEDLAVPVSVWQGEQDLMTPFAHGRWLAEHVPGARAHLLPDEGHLSIAAGRLGDVSAELRELAGR